MTVVYVTHDQEEAMNMSDRIAIMNHGRIEQLGPPAEIYERPLNAFVGRFLGEANLIEGTIERIETAEAVLRSRDGIALRARFKGVATPGRAASLFVRPEKLAFGEMANANRVEGTVRRRSFLGNIIRTVVDAGPSTQLTVDLPNLAAGSGPAVGTRVAASWSAAHSLVLLA
jgi:ABC-type Fe3+/spermidine/putrescine transport system ATPase subunit